MTLRTYTGGYLRFEDDHYTGDRPWVIATLWMALYYIEIGKIKEAKQCFEFVVKTQNPHSQKQGHFTVTSAFHIY